MSQDLSKQNTSASSSFSTSAKHWVVVPAAGVGKRMQAAQPKQYISILGRTVLERTLSQFLTDPDFAGVFVGVSPSDPYWESLDISTHAKVERYKGGQERVDTVYQGLLALAAQASDEDWVWVHDAARPCLSLADIDALKRELEQGSDGALLAVKINDTVKRANAGGKSNETIDREHLWRAMTPQVFRYKDLKQALEECRHDDVFVTDDASAMEYAGVLPTLVPGSEQNIKITRPEDLLVAERFFEQRGERMIPRIGSGYDVHAFEVGDFITIGGVQIPHLQGLKAHSDGDVLLHALADALLGALALGDIGKHFPDTDDKWQGADSRMLLRAVFDLIKERGYLVGNVDVTVIAQAPKMAPHIVAIQENIAADLEIPINAVGVKATTTEKLGFTGRKEGIAAQASVLLVPERL